MRLIFLGPPGAGKGTQAARIAEKHGLAHLATGDMLRAATAGDSPLSEKARAIMASGGLLPDEMIIELISAPVSGAKTTGFILDGFPRTVPQAEALDKLLAALNAPLEAVIAFDLDEKAIRQRIIGRGSEAGQHAREDDRQEVITRRMAEYRRHTQPLRDYYQAKGLLRPVDAAGTVEQVSAEIEEILAEKVLTA